MVNSSVRESGGLKLPEINHLGVVVRNRDEAIRRYREALGLPPFRTWDQEFPDTRVRGKPSPCSLRIGFSNLGTVLFEVIEPLAGESIHREFLERNGEGIQHLGFVVADLAGDLAKLAANGLQVLMDSPIAERQSALAYVDGDAASNILWELVQDSPGMQRFYQRLWETTRA